MTRFLYTVDVKFQEFLHSCKLAKNRDDVDDRILNVSDLIQAVRFGGFSMDLPPNTRILSNDKVSQEIKEGERKKQKPNPREDGKRPVVNKNQNPELKMKTGKDWKKDFVGKHAKFKPAWEGNSSKVKMCPRWHSRRDCFKDCNNAASHVPSHEIPAEKKTSYCNYLKRLRKED